MVFDEEAEMGYPTKVQLIRRKDSQQWYINFPSALAGAMQFAKGETVEWEIRDKYTLILHRPEAGSDAGRKTEGKKKRQSWRRTSPRCGTSARMPSGNTAVGNAPSG